MLPIVVIKLAAHMVKVRQHILDRARVEYLSTPDSSACFPSSGRHAFEELSWQDDSRQFEYRRIQIEQLSHMLLLSSRIFSIGQYGARLILCQRRLA